MEPNTGTITEEGNHDDEEEEKEEEAEREAGGNTTPLFMSSLGLPSTRSRGFTFVVRERVVAPAEGPRLPPVEVVDTASVERSAFLSDACAACLSCNIACCTFQYRTTFFHIARRSVIGPAWGMGRDSVSRTATVRVSRTPLTRKQFLVSSVSAVAGEAETGPVACGMGMASDDEAEGNGGEYGGPSS